MAGRIDWTDDERKKWFDATVEMVRQQKLKPPTDWKGVAAFMKIARQALVVLPENRRRPLTNADTIRLDIPKFIEAGILPANVMELRKDNGRGGANKDDPTTIRMNQLADERDAAVKLAEEMQEKSNSMANLIIELRRELQRVPTEAQVVKTFIADILADVQARGRALPGPTGDEINRLTREYRANTSAAMERETLHRKHNPEGTSDERPKKPTVAIFTIETAPSAFSKWQEQFPDLGLRQVDVRADGRVHVPSGAMEALLVHGVRHATSEEVRRHYPGAKIVMNTDIPKQLAMINERVKGSKNV